MPRTHWGHSTGASKHAVVAPRRSWPRRKIAERVYRLLKYGEAYVRQEMEAAEQAYTSRRLHGIARAAKELGYQLVATETGAADKS